MSVHVHWFPHGLQSVTFLCLATSEYQRGPSHLHLLAQGAVWSCVLDKGALKCATGSGDFSARVWDACSGTQLHQFTHDHIVRSVNFSHSSSLLATGGRWDLLHLTAKIGSQTSRFVSACNQTHVVYQCRLWEATKNTQRQIS